MIACCVSCVDPSLGKVDKASLPQQTLMELVLVTITDKEEICGPTENVCDIFQWEGVRLNENGNVIEVNWFMRGLQGTVEVGWLPPTVERFNCSSNDLTGTLNLTSLPPPLRDFFLGWSKFYGAINLKHLPAKIHQIFLCQNRLTGTLCLKTLPHSLAYLVLSKNGFTGGISL